MTTVNFLRHLKIIKHKYYSYVSKFRIFGIIFWCLDYTPTRNCFQLWFISILIDLNYVSILFCYTIQVWDSITNTIWIQYSVVKNKYNMNTIICVYKVTIRKKIYGKVNRLSYNNAPVNPKHSPISNCK